MALVLPSRARDDGAPSYMVDRQSADPSGFRTAQAWFPPAPRYERHDPNARYYYLRPRDAYGRPGPVYRVLGVEKRKRKKPVDRHKLRAAEQLRKAPAPPPTTGPLLVAVSLAKQRITLFDHGVAVADAPISSGKARTPTPTGVFSVIQKQWWHRSNLYSAAPMPFMQRLTWSGIALHAGDLPGYPASHGCIRLPDDFAIRLWGTTRVGTRVIVTHGEITPLEIAHPRLFAPKAKRKDDQPERPPAAHEASLLERLAERSGIAVPPVASLARQGKLSLADAPTSGPLLERAVAGDGMEFLAQTNGPLTLVNPDGSPLAEGDDVALDDADDVDDAEDVNEDGPAVADAAAPAVAEAPAIPEVPHAAAVAARETAPKAAPKVNRITIVRPGQPDEVLEIPEAAGTEENGTQESGTQESGLATITVVRGGRPTEIEVIAVSRPTPRTQVALPLPDTKTPLVVAYNGDMTLALRTRRPRKAQPAQLPVTPPGLQARPLRPGPLSVFVSRKERRLYVRKGFEPLFDVPVTIAEPGRALGNHVFTAMAVTETDARWNVISLPEERWGKVRRTVEYGRGKKKRRYSRWVKEYISSPSPASASEALDRIDIPPEAVTRISELLSVGATLIVSDEGLGRETGRETDFTVLTK